MNNKTVLLRAFLLTVAVGTAGALVLELSLSEVIIYLIVGGICLAITVWWVKPLEGMSERTRIVYGPDDREKREER